MNPNVFATLIRRLENLKTMILTFTNANNVCIRAKSKADSKIAYRIILHTIQCIEIEYNMSNFYIQNIVSSTNTDFLLKLNEIAAKHSLAAIYNLTVFFRLIYRMKDMKIVFLVFRKGKIMITGGKNRAQITSVVDTFYKLVLLTHIDTSNMLNYVPSEKPANLFSILIDMVKKFEEDKDIDNLLDKSNTETFFEDLNIEYIKENMYIYQDI